MKSLKTLMLAVAGLAGLGIAGSAFAQCANSNLTAWSGGTSALSGGTVNVVTGGLDGSACSMSTTLGSSSASQATVADSSPNNEPRYRFQFLLNADGVSAFSSTDGVVIFTASGGTTVNGRRGIIQVNLVPSATGRRLSFTYSCNNGTTFRCSGNTGSVNLTSGVNRIEFDIQMATTGNSDGSIRYWINAAAGTTEPAPSGSVTSVNNSAWVGVKLAALGLGSPTPTYSTGHTGVGQPILFDAFDSRRQTYIGH